MHKKSGLLIVLIAVLGSGLVLWFYASPKITSTSPVATTLPTTKQSPSTLPSEIDSNVEGKESQKIAAGIDKWQTHKAQGFTVQYPVDYQVYPFQDPTFPEGFTINKSGETGEYDYVVMYQNDPGFLGPDDDIFHSPAEWAENQKRVGQVFRTEQRGRTTLYITEISNDNGLHTSYIWFTQEGESYTWHQLSNNGYPGKQETNALAKKVIQTLQFN
jgi:hypothetical protein